jgi:hypothetical protein
MGSIVASPYATEFCRHDRRAISADIVSVGCLWLWLGLSGSFASLVQHSPADPHHTTHTRYRRSHTSSKRASPTPTTSVPYFLPHPLPASLSQLERAFAPPRRTIKPRSPQPSLARRLPLWLEQQSLPTPFWYPISVFSHQSRPVSGYNRPRPTSSIDARPTWRVLYTSRCTGLGRATRGRRD